MEFATSAKAWQLVSLAVLALLVMAALGFDIRQRRIPNALVLVTVGAGLVIHLLGPQAGPRMAGGLITSFPGALGLEGAVLGALTGLAIFGPLHLVHAIGAGDVKLMAGMGSFVGPVTTIDLALFIWLTGGVLALARMVWTCKSNPVIRTVVTAIGHMLSGSAEGSDATARDAHRMPYSATMAGGLLIYSVWIFSGGNPIISF